MEILKSLAASERPQVREMAHLPGVRFLLVGLRQAGTTPGYALDADHRFLHALYVRFRHNRAYRDATRRSAVHHQEGALGGVG
jgi:hypothetical protein